MNTQTETNTYRGRPSLAETHPDLAAEILALLREVVIDPEVVALVGADEVREASQRVLAKRGYNIAEIQTVMRESSRLHRITQATLDD